MQAGCFGGCGDQQRRIFFGLCALGLPSVRPQIIDGRGGGLAGDDVGCIAQFTEETDVGGGSKHDEFVERPAHFLERLFS